MNSLTPVRRLVVNADDFGRSAAINAAVIRAHREGILTTASLMVNEPGCAEAVALAREHPRLGVGLHLTFLCGRAALPPERIPGLVNAAGEFTNVPAGAGCRYFFQRSLREQLRAEIHAQFARFRATGLVLDHVNGHLHLHLHPTIFRLLMEDARELGIERVRLTREPLFLGRQKAQKTQERGPLTPALSPSEEAREKLRPCLASSSDATGTAGPLTPALSPSEGAREKLPPRSAEQVAPGLLRFLRLFAARSKEPICTNGAMYQLSHALIFGALSGRARPELEQRGFRHTDYVFGLLQNAQVDEEYVQRLLPRLPAGDSELYSHPSLDEFRNEFEALISPRVRTLVEKMGIKLIRYQDL